MHIGLRIALIFGAILMLAFVLLKIRRSQLKTSDSVFWFLFAGCLVVIAVFPQIVYWAASLIGIQSPVNLVYLIIIAILIIRLLMNSVEISLLRKQLKALVQQCALNDKEGEDE